MEYEVLLKLTLRESDFLSELLSQEYNYGNNSDVRKSVEEKLENERLKIVELRENMEQELKERRKYDG